MTIYGYIPLSHIMQALSLDGTGVEKMIEDYKNKSLERKQLG